jgi:hypothetical protein
MKLKHSLPKIAIDRIEFIHEGSGEAGWMVSLKDGYTFDPGSRDQDRFVPADCAGEVFDFVVYTAAKSASAADNDLQ